MVCGCSQSRWWVLISLDARSACLVLQTTCCQPCPGCKLQMPLSWEQTPRYSGQHWLRLSPAELWLELIPCGVGTLVTLSQTARSMCQHGQLCLVLNVSTRIFCPSVCLSGWLSVCCSVCLSVCQSVCMSVCGSVCLSVCLFVLPLSEHHFSVHVSRFC